MGNILSNCDLQMPQTSYSGAHKLRAVKKYYQNERTQFVNNSKIWMTFNKKQRVEKHGECRLDENKTEQ